MNINVTSSSDTAAATAAEMSDQDFGRVAELVRNVTGIQLPEHKRTLARSRLSKRLSALGIGSFEKYLDQLESGRFEDELTEFCNALTTNLTSFFREPHHFEHLAKELTAISNDESLRIWSAGCSSGEETYSIAMTALSDPEIAARPDKRILATDLDTNVLKTARRGVYSSERISGVPEKLRKNFLTAAAGGDFQVSKSCQDLIIFNRLNLLGDWPITIQFDVIFCRNVMIYFDKKTQQMLIERLLAQLKERGVLYIGHSETALGRHPLLHCEGHTIYRKRS